MRLKFSLFIMLFIFLSNSLLFCQEDSLEAKKIVNNYLREQLAVSISTYYKIQDYFHPDLAFPPGEIQYLHVVDSDFSIVQIREKMMDINLMEPREEQITIVTVLFKRYCDIYDNEFIPEKKDYTRDYFLSKSTGELLIIDFDDPPEKTVTLENAIQWASGMKGKSKRWSDLYTKLIVLQEQQKQEDK